MTQLAWGRYIGAALPAAWSAGYLLLALLWWPPAVVGHGKFTVNDGAVSAAGLS